MTEKRSYSLIDFHNYIAIRFDEGEIEERIAQGWHVKFCRIYYAYDGNPRISFWGILFDNI